MEICHSLKTIPVALLIAMNPAFATTTENEPIENNAPKIEYSTQQINPQDNIRLDFPRAKSQTLKDNIIQYAHDFYIGDKGYTMYYTNGKHNNTPNLVTAVYIVPEDYKEVKVFDVEVTHPLEVERFILHITKNNQYWGVQTTEIKREKDGKNYRINKEMILPEHIGDKIFLLLIDETKFTTTPYLKKCVKVVYTDQLQPTVKKCVSWS